MAIRYHYDLYPRTDPRDGARIRRFTKLQRAIYRDVIGVGSGAADIRSTDAEAADLDPRGEQYVRVVREDTVAETELVVGGWWVNRYNHDTAVARQTKRLTFAGAGTMAYLARARMWSHTYMWELDNDFVPQDPFDDVWRLWNQGNWAGGDYLGAVLWRVIQEALHYRTGSTYTHRHKDGETYTDAHDDDRTATQGSSIEFVTLGFDQFEDSDGTPWTWPSGEFQASVGENLLSVVQRIMQAGLFVQMDPDTFELRAWQGRPASKLGRSTDRTGGAWATGVVRFQAPTDGTVATGNMLNDSEREINSHLPRHIILAGGQDTYARAIAAIGNGIRWEGFESSTATDVDALEQIAATQITAREEAADAGSIRMKLGTSQVSGKYRPWEEVRLDDLVTVHTGTGEWDYDEATYPVAGLKIELRKSGAWWAWAELGASFNGGQERKFQVAPAAAHSHPPNPQLCRPTSGAAEPTVLFRYTSLDTVMTASPGIDAAWDHGSSAFRHELTVAPGSTRNGGLSDTQRNDVLHDRFTIGPMDSATAALIAAGGATILMHARARMRAGVGVDDGAQDGISQMGVRVTAGDSTTIRGTALALHNLGSSAGSAQWNKSSTYRNMEWPAAAATNVLTAVPATVAGDFLLIEVGCRNFTGGAIATGSHVWFNDSAAAAGDLPADLVTTANLRSWVQLTGAGTPGTGDGHIDLVGTSVRASRCDHRHDVHRDRAPTAADDGSLGYKLGTLWAQLDDLDNPTAIVGVWMLVDTTTGAAVWLSIGSSAAPVVSLDDLTDVVLGTPATDDDLRFDGENWINDPRKWEAVTDGEDVFVWEDDDLVHEWNEAP